MEKSKYFWPKIFFRALFSTLSFPGRYNKGHKVRPCKKRIKDGCSH